MLQQRLDLGCEREQPAVPVIVEGLDAQPVARAEQPLPLGVPDCECEHTPQQPQAIRTVLFVGVEDGLGVGTRLVAMAGPFERRTQRRMVVDLAVEGDPERAGFVGLNRAGGRPEYR